jgi:sodium-dependent phosphate transporter
VTDTIRNQIADVGAFAEKPDVFAYGMLCAMLATGLWLVSGEQRQSSGRLAV